MLWIQVLAFFPLAVLGIYAGHRAGRHRWAWKIVVTAALIFIGLVMVGHRSARLAFVPPVAFAIGAEINPLLMTPIIGALFSALAARLPARRSRPATFVAMGAMMLHYGLMPAVMPLAVRGALVSTTTHFDKDRICLQTHAYTCGPASAVTCLARLGVSAEEAELALDAHCAPAFGTDAWELAAAINRRYAGEGISCHFQYFDSLDGLSTPAIADTVSPLIGGHYVAVLEVTPESVVVGDPLSGVRRMPRREFLEIWKGTAIIFVQHPVRRAIWKQIGA